MNKPSMPKGTRDFTPVEMLRRKYIFNTIESIFNKYGYLPIETPAMENLSTLLGKYGEEGDKLLFRILNSGEYLSKTGIKDITSVSQSEFSAKISDKGLKYDLTVPFARFVVQHRNEITFPFKRYQMQPVWRADKPQKGRYREFYQCDVDVIGSNSLLNEVELLLIIDEVFKMLNIEVEIMLNNRKILSGISEYIGEKDRMMDITIAVDKLEKIGIEGVSKELIQKGIPGSSIEKLKPVLNLKGKLKEKFPALKELLKNTEEGVQGVEELMTIMQHLKELQIHSKFNLDLTLARGLNYYTGIIIEVKAKDMNIGSICGGGRYDDLTGIFGLKDVSGVGISFGADRIYDVLEELKLFPAEESATTQVFFVNFGGDEEKHALKLIKKLREKGIASEIYPEAAKMKKQFTYANNKSIPYVIIIGENEIRNKSLTIKDMGSGKQEEIKEEELFKRFIK